MTAASTARILLTDAAVKREPFALGKPRIVRDSKIAGLHVWIGKRKKTFRYQYETPRLNGRVAARRSNGWASIRITVRMTRAPRRSPFKPRASAANTCGPLSKRRRRG